MSVIPPQGRPGVDAGLGNHESRLRALERSAPDPLLPVARMWAVIPANTIAPNTDYDPDLTSDGVFKTNDPDGLFQERDFPYAGDFYEWGDFGLDFHLKVKGPGLFRISGWWSLRNLLLSFSPSNPFTVSLRVGTPIIQAPESDDPDSTKPIPLAVAINTAPTPDEIYDPTSDTEKTFPVSTLTTSVSTPYWVAVEKYVGLRNTATAVLVHLDMTHNLRNNAGTLITPDFATDAGLAAIRLGDFA